MSNVFKRVRLGFLVLAAGFILPGVLLADANFDAPQAQVENLATQLEEVRTALARSEQGNSEQSNARTEEIAALRTVTLPTRR